jgi:hypothetical protein
MDRRRFLRHLGTALAAGVGVSLVPRAALAGVTATGACCPAGWPCPACPAGWRRFRCRTQYCDYCICTVRYDCFRTDC